MPLDARNEARLSLRGGETWNQIKYITKRVMLHFR
jgi:hypothetical protein